MRKRSFYSQKTYRLASIAVAAVLALTVPLAGCSKKGGPAQGTAAETEVSMELDLSCYLTGTAVFTDTEGKERTSVRFLIENNDKENKDWVKGINGKEYLKTGKEEIQVYSRYVNDHCRYVDGAMPGCVQPEDVIYTAGNFICAGWQQAGDVQYKEIGAITEDGVPYFYTGCGVSTGIAGNRVLCVWLAGFTPDSVPVDGARPQLTCADRFSLVTADGGEIPEWEGMAGVPDLSVNEFGVEVSIQAEDADTLMRSIASTGLSLRHTSADGVTSDFELKQKGVPAARSYSGSEEAADTADAADTEAAEDGEGPAETDEGAEGDESEESAESADTPAGTETAGAAEITESGAAS